MRSWLVKIQEKPSILLVLATFFWGSNFVISRLIVVDVIPPVHLSILRWGIAFFFFFPFAWQEWKHHRDKIWDNKLVILILSLTGISIYNTLIYIAVQYTTSINASLVNATAPIIIVILSIFILGEKMVKIQYMGTVISFIGVVWIITGGQLDRLRSLTFNIGDLLVFLAVLSWAVYSIVMKKWGAHIPKRATFLTTMGLGALLLLPFGIWENGATNVQWANIDFQGWVGIIYLGIFPSVIAFLCWNEGVIRIGPSRSSNFLYFMVVFAGMMATIAGERYTLIQFIGAMLILAGVILVLNPFFLKKGLKIRNKSI